MNAVSRGLSRRLILSRSAAVVGASSAGLLLPQIVRAQGNKVRVGFMLPYTGTYAQLGVAIENGVRMAIEELNAKGMVIAEPSAALKAEFAKIGATMTEEWVKTAGADGKAIVDAYRKN